MTAIDPESLRELAGFAFGDEDEEQAAPERKTASLERYKLGPRLGKGAHGTVHRAHDRVLGRDVALKLLTETADADALARFQREVRMAAALRHPHLVTVHEAGVHQGRPFYSMELIQGRTLLSLARGDAREIVGLAAQVARGLHAAHSAGIVHRDVKPENIMIAADGRAVLVDFSLAREMLPDAHLTRTGTAAGTPCYMAPEQARGKRAAIDARTDVYGLGATLFHVLSGRPPHEGADPQQVLASVTTRDAPALRSYRSELPAALETIVRKAMAREPRERYPSALLLALDLEALLAGGPARPRVERPRARWVLPVLLLGAGVVLAAAAWWGTQPAPVVEVATVAPVDTTPRWFYERPADARPMLPLRPGLSCSPRPGVYLWDSGRGFPFEVVYVPPGDFVMGSVWCGNAAPVHLHQLSHGYFLGRFELTWGQYRRYLAAIGGEYRDPPDSDLKPITLSWEQAEACAAWYGMRLPSDAEWEKAARGTDGGHWPWGGKSLEDFAPRCNYNDASCKVPLGSEERERDPWNQVDDGFPGVAPVGSYPQGASPYGALDMSGNLPEWCEDWFHEQANAIYVQYGLDRYPPRAGTMRAYRGGSWNWIWWTAYPAHRLGNPSHGYNGIGARFALSEDPTRD